jgi:hypothetical protein
VLILERRFASKSAALREASRKADPDKEVSNKTVRQEQQYSGHSNCLCHKNSSKDKAAYIMVVSISSIA